MVADCGVHADNDSVRSIRDGTSQQKGFNASELPAQAAV
jgi:hypothetical protein